MTQCLEWARRNGAVIDGLDVTESYGYGLVITHLPARLHIPNSIVITSDAIHEFSKSCPSFKRILDDWLGTGLPESFTLLASLLLWYENTPWSPYFNTLPKELYLPVFWPERELLRGTSIEGLSTIVEESLLSYVSSKGVKVPTLERWVYYNALVASRTLKGATSSLVPVLDFVNHSSLRPPHANCQNASWSVTETGFDLEILPHAKIGDEVLFSYGELGNAELLLTYGFTEPQEMSRHMTVEYTIDDTHEIIHLPNTNIDPAIVSQQLSLLMEAERDPELIALAEQSIPSRLAMINDVRDSEEQLLRHYFSRPAVAGG